MHSISVKYPEDEQWRAGEEIIRTLRSAGYEAYFVGGCVRDILLGLEPEDYDIATSAKPEEVLSLHPKADKTGMRYGVLGVTVGGANFQIATYRRDDPAGDGRRPRRIYYADLLSDSARRDFTINAIYLNPLTREFRDPQKGIADIEGHLLRIIGEPEQRFQEDHLRILRAVRFASRFGFTVEERTFTALKKSAPLAARISPDRIQDELLRTFTEGDKIFALELLQKTEVLPILWDNFAGADNKLLASVKEELLKTGGKDAEEVWPSFFLPWYRAGIPGAEIESAMRRINLSRKMKASIRKTAGQARKADEETD